MSGYPPHRPGAVPDGVSATGVQRALGERRRQRSRERGGQIDLDATMSSWPQPDPPSRPRPVVRPRQARPGTATSPGLPTPHVLMLREAGPGTRTASGSPAGEPETDATGPRRRRGSPATDTAATAAALAAPGTAAAPAAPAGAGMPTGPVSATGPVPAERRRGRGRGGAPVGDATGGVSRAAVAAGAGAAAGAAVAWVTSDSGRGDPAGRVGPGGADPDREDPGRVGPGRVGPGRVGPGRVGPGRVGPGRVDPGRVDTAARDVGSPGPATGRLPAEQPARPSGRGFPSRMPPRDFQSAPPGASPDIDPAVQHPETAPPPGQTPSSGDTGDPFTAFVRSPARPPGTPAGAVGASPEPGPGTGPRRQTRRPSGAGGFPPAPETPSAFDGASGPPTRSGILRSRAALALAAAVVAVLVVAAAAVLVRSDSGAEAAPDLVPATTPQQDTVLVALLAGDGTIARAVLLAEGPTAGGQQQVVSVLLPGELMVQVPDQGTFSLAQAVTVDEEEAVDRGVEDALGIRVGGTWAMDPDLLADLVDSVGGVEVDVTTPIAIDDVTVPVGPSQLTGAQAAAYSRAIIDEEGPDGALARFGQVILGLLASLPDEAGEVTQTLSAVERDPATTITSEQLSETLAGGAAIVGEVDPVQPVRLPTEPAGDDDTLVGADQAALATLVDEQLPGAQLPVAQVGALNVFVGNAVGTPGLVTAARDRLVESGFRFVGGGTADTVEEQTQVLLREDTPENRARGEAVAAALGVSPDALRVRSDFGDGVPEETDVIVWLEQDFADVVGDEGS